MTDSIFRRINREVYRREMIRQFHSISYYPAWLEKYRKEEAVHYFPNSSNKYARIQRRILWLWLLLFVPWLFYGFCLKLLHDNKEWLGAVTSWTSPWLEDQLKVYVPSINKVSKNLIERGYSDLAPLAQHVYSVGILSSVIMFIGFCYMFWVARVIPLRLKRSFTIQCSNGSMNCKTKLLMLLLLIGALLYWWFNFLYTGFLDDGHVAWDSINRLFLFNHTTWASLFLLFMSGASVFLIVGGIMFTHYCLRRWYINISLSIKRLKIMQRSKIAE